MLGREPHRSACFCSPNAAGILIPCRHALLFTLWVWNSGLRDCKARGLLTELSPHSPSAVFIREQTTGLWGSTSGPFCPRSWVSFHLCKVCQKHPWSTLPYLWVGGQRPPSASMRRACAVGTHSGKLYRAPQQRELGLLGTDVAYPSSHAGQVASAHR